jgi:peptidylamidoglycolate lyase
MAMLTPLGTLRSTEPAPISSGYEVVHGWPQLPEGLILGAVAGVGVDSKGVVWVFQRGGRQWTEPMPTEPINAPTVIAFDGDTGRVLSSWGDRRFIMPHGLSVDAQDNIWLTDVGLHQVFKFSPKGELLLTVGERGVSGSDAKHFNRPTDVAVLPDGSFYVSDGYLNTRVAKFSADGRFLFAWGAPGKEPGQFDAPHALAVDEDGKVYVADRENDRIQVFDASGRFVRQWSSTAQGRPYALTLLPGNLVAVVDGGEQPQKGPDRSGVAIVRRDGSLVERFSRFGNYDGQLQQGHDIASNNQGDLYVADIGGERVQKFTKHRR